MPLLLYPWRNGLFSDLFGRKFYFKRILNINSYVLSPYQALLPLFFSPTSQYSILYSFLQKRDGTAEIQSLAFHFQLLMLQENTKEVL